MNKALNSNMQRIRIAAIIFLMPVQVFAYYIKNNPILKQFLV